MALHVARVPGDKSISHRALILAAVAEGDSTIRGLLRSDDTRSTASALRALGVEVPALDGPDPLLLRGRGLRGLERPDAALDCGNSGTTARLLLGLLAGAGVPATVTGDASLRRRPMRRVTGPLIAAGAVIRELGEPDRLPVRIEAGVRRAPSHHSPAASAQVKSALLLAGLTSGRGAEVTEPVLSRDHTERMLRAMGASVRRGGEHGRALAAIEPDQRLRSTELPVPGDLSSAAYLLAAAVLAGRGIRVPGVGVNDARAGLLAVLRRMGATIRLENRRELAGEPVADLVVPPGQVSLSGVTVPADQVPAMIDEIPVLAVLAARARGETVIEGAGELRLKESDRIGALVENLRALGVEADGTGDRLAVRGGTGALAGRVRGHGDHRIVMAFGLLNVLPDHEIEIDDPQVATVSYPGFWDEIERFTDTLENR